MREAKNDPGDLSSGFSSASKDSHATVSIGSSTHTHNRLQRFSHTHTHKVLLSASHMIFTLKNVKFNHLMIT